MSRYIDAEKLKADVRDKYKGLPDRCEINSIINLQPTADVVPRARYKQLLENSTIMADALKEYENEDVRENVRGEWIDMGSGQVCSECHEIQYGYDNYRRYCPNCGADMRGEE